MRVTISVVTGSSDIDCERSAIFRLGNGTQTIPDPAEPEDVCNVNSLMGEVAHEYSKNVEEPRQPDCTTSNGMQSHTERCISDQTS
jgi:hypothetical protein